MTHGSLFSGVGGFDLGFKWAGIKTLWEVEIDPYCRQVLERQFPDARRFNDIRECGKHNLPAVDILSGGFPCQPVSTAGFRRGMADDRWLWPEMLRIIEELGPSYVTGENVNGIESLGLDGILSDLEGVGYETTALSIPACACGLQTMERHYWIIATSARIGQQRSKTLQNQDHGNEGQFQGTDTRTHNRRPISETRFCRVGERVSRRMEPNQRKRLHALGNAIPPQIAEYIGRCIMTHAGAL